MSDVELILVNEGKNCTVYTIHFLSDDVNEFEKFYNKFKDDLEVNQDLMRIVEFIDRIADVGSFERYFRPEGKVKDKVVALPVFPSKLRLYCLRLSDRILILGNGGTKSSKRYEDDAELKGYVLTMQKFDQLIDEGIKNGTIKVTENKIETGNNIII